MDILKFLKKVETLVSKAVSFSVESLWQKEVRFDVLLASLGGKFRRIISYKLSADTDEYGLSRAFSRIQLTWKWHDFFHPLVVLIFILEHPSRIEEHAI